MTTLDVLLRLGAAVFCGGVIGLNRDLRGKPAGVRTHALVALGAAVVTLVAAAEVNGAGDTSGVSRVMQGVITGIGFLGAGLILRPRSGQGVRGLTTAASIWVVAALGIACGRGNWVPAAVGTGLTLFVLLSGGPAERGVQRLVGRRRPDHPPENPPPPSS